MKKTKIIYWILTGMFLFVMLGSAVPDVLVQDMAVQGFKDMGLPKYLVPFVGWAKVLGVLAILVPGNSRLKEWAYAGLMIDLVGATYCIASSGIAFSQWAPMFIFIALGFGSYAYFRKLQKLKAVSEPVQRRASTDMNFVPQVATN